MSTLRKVVVCVNHRANPDLPSCGARGGEAIASRLEDELRQRDLGITVERFNCLGQCEAGPNIRLAPAGPFYQGLAESDIPMLMIDIETFFKR